MTDETNPRPFTLVTGGAGFVGSHLVDRLLAMGRDVCVLDVFSESSGRFANLHHVRDRVRLVNTDVRELDARPLRRELEGQVGGPVRFSEVYHLACPASPAFYKRDPLRTITTAFEGTRRVLELAREEGATLLVTSTSEVYGDPLVHPQHEGYPGNVDCLGPRSSYDEGKRAAEALCLAYGASVDCRIARLFNCYGPRMAPDDGRVVSNFVVRALKNEPLRVLGGQQTRSFCHVSDAVDGLARMMLVARPAGSSFPLVLNIGNPEETTVLDLARKVIRLTGSSSDVELVSGDATDPRRRCPDTTLANRILRWFPLVGLDAGLQTVIDHFRGAPA
jgi:UDP-glucuronate decarboxylase